jgi:hypothetical protein
MGYEQSNVLSSSVANLDLVIEAASDASTGPSQLQMYTSPPPSCIVLSQVQVAHRQSVRLDIASQSPPGQVYRPQLLLPPRPVYSVQFYTP